MFNENSVVPTSGLFCVLFFYQGSSELGLMHSFEIKLKSLVSDISSEVVIRWKDQSFGQDHVGDRTRIAGLDDGNGLFKGFKVKKIGDEDRSMVH